VFELRWSKMLAMSVAASHVSSILLEKEALVQTNHGIGVEPWPQSLLTEDRDQWGCSVLRLVLLNVGCILSGEKQQTKKEVAGGLPGGLPGGLLRSYGGDGTLV